MVSWVVPQHDPQGCTYIIIPECEDSWINHICYQYPINKVHDWERLHFLLEISQRNRRGDGELERRKNSWRWRLLAFVILSLAVQNISANKMVLLLVCTASQAIILLLLGGERRGGGGGGKYSQFSPVSTPWSRNNEVHTWGRNLTPMKCWRALWVLARDHIFDASFTTSAFYFLHLLCRFRCLLPCYRFFSSQCSLVRFFFSFLTHFSKGSIKICVSLKAIKVAHQWNGSSISHGIFMWDTLKSVSSPTPFCSPIAISHARCSLSGAYASFQKP